jgi:glutathione synthase/RimK-type ligase-like ATP-grasp enzyme
MTTDELRVGVILLPKKYAKHQFEICERVNFYHLQLEDLTASRLGALNIHILVHKLSDFHLEEPQLAVIWKELQVWGGRVIDDYSAVSLLTDRLKTCEMLSSFAPPHGVLLPPTNLTPTTPLSFPLIRKPVSACSKHDAHHMVLYHTNSQVQTSPEYILQQYVPHGGVLYKIYVVGDHIRVQVRSSLEAGLQGDALFFNSRAMKAAAPVTTEAIAEAMSRFAPLEDRIMQFTRALRSHLRLTLFGWDLIIEEQSNSPYIIDVNYFPGYDEIDFINLLSDELLREYNRH